MSDSANRDNNYNWLRAAATEPAGGPDAGAAMPDDNPMPFAAPRGMPVLPRYGGNGANATPASTPPPAPGLAAQAAPAAAVSDLPTAGVSSASSAPASAPSISDLPTTRMPSASVSSPPAPAHDVSDLPTQRVTAAPLPAAPTVEAPPAGPTTIPSTERTRSRGALLLAAAMVIVLLVAISAALLSAALGPGTPTPISSGAYHQAFTAAAEGWPTSGACQFTASGYAVSGPSVCFYNGQDVGDATVSVTMTRASGAADSSAGIAFRRTGPGAFYTFEIDGNGNWVIYKRGTALQQGDSDAIKTDAGAKNTLQVQMKGGHFTFSVNGAQVAQADDAEFANGKVGLTGYTGLAVIYTDFSITPL